jgi:hypothetical protein
MGRGAKMVAFGLGLLWMALTGVQTKLLVKTSSEILLFAWAMGTSLIWGYLVRAVILDSRAIIPYAVGTAFGALLARRLGKCLGQS